MRVFYDENVFDAAKRRVRHLISKYNCVVTVSGGKDSTVVLNLALDAAREMGKLPLKVLFLDQEAEYQCGIDYIRTIMNRPDVEPYWYQMPCYLFNANSAFDEWLHCWNPEDEERWMRPMEPNSIRVNDTGVEKIFVDILTAVQVQHFSEDTVFLGGVRAEESPNRFRSLTHHETIDGFTWGKILSKKKRQYVMYPIYDWSYRDVWKAIHDEKWEYCPLYDHQYMLGVPIQRMRLSSLCHEISSVGLRYLQEVEPDTWNKLCARLRGVGTMGKFNWAMTCPTKLPFMFTDWKEYRDYLAENLLPPEGRGVLQKKFAKMDAKFSEDVYYQTCISSILLNDYYGTALNNFVSSVSFGKTGSPRAKPVISTG